MGLFDVLLPYQAEFAFSKKKRKIWTSARQVGKSFTLAGMLVRAALSRREGLALCVSTGQRAASELVKKCGRWAEAVALASGGRVSYQTGADHVQFSNGCRVLSLPNSPAACRGFSASMVAVDEAAYVENL